MMALYSYCEPNDGIKQISHFQRKEKRPFCGFLPLIRHTEKEKKTQKARLADDSLQGKTVRKERVGGDSQKLGPTGGALKGEGDVVLLPKGSRPDGDHKRLDKGAPSLLNQVAPKLLFVFIQNAAG